MITPPAAATIDFHKDIRPLLEQACVGCHGAEKQKGRLRLDTKSDALKGGKNGVVIKANDAAAYPGIGGSGRDPTIDRITVHIALFSISGAVGLNNNPRAARCRLTAAASEQDRPRIPALPLVG